MKRHIPIRRARWSISSAPPNAITLSSSKTRAYKAVVSSSKTNAPPSSARAYPRRAPKAAASSSKTDAPPPPRGLSSPHRRRLTLVQDWCPTVIGLSLSLCLASRTRPILSPYHCCPSSLFFNRPLEIDV
jgi:hypothetical protein